MKIPEGVGSKYRFIVLSGQRVAQLQKGAKPRIQGIRKLTTIAMNELGENLLVFNKKGTLKGTDPATEQDTVAVESKSEQKPPEGQAS